MAEDRTAILLVEDDPDYAALFRAQLQANYDLTVVSSAEDGLDAIDSGTDYIIVVSDYDLPGINGIEFLERVRERVPQAVRIMLTGHADLAGATEAINKGNVFRYLVKSAHRNDLTAALADARNHYMLEKSQHELLEHTLSGAIKLMIELLSITYPEIFGRSRKIRTRARAMATRLNIEQTWEIDVAALLSHVGCITLSRDLVKKWIDGEELSKAENDMVSRHPEVGRNLLMKIPRLENVANAVGNLGKFNLSTSGLMPLRKAARTDVLTSILQAAMEFESILATGIAESEALDRLHHESARKYYSEVLAALRGEILKAKVGHIVVEIPVSQLAAGMIVADDIRNSSGYVLIPRNHEVSEVERIRVTNIAERSPVGPIRILLKADD